ncbi:hypothetical protein EYF80_038406 [Liparis tanakae]|uniref:Uncharacterized protein n=1 Tax=Liparis tanakae TaxID=230148 RepID=A0A4Z2GDE2_9TELE|nr:hypothetical protein EYF80_038406 [Liparis tanakae]
MLAIAVDGIIVVDVSMGRPLPPSPEHSSFLTSSFTGFSSVLMLLSLPPLEQLPGSLSSSSSCCLTSVLGSRLAVEALDCGCWEDVSRLLTEAGLGAVRRGAGRQPGVRWSGGTRGAHVLLLEGLVGAGALAELVLRGGRRRAQLRCIRGVRLRGLGPGESGGGLVRGGRSTVSGGGRATHVGDGVGQLARVGRSHRGGADGRVGTAAPRALRTHGPHRGDAAGPAGRTRLC